LRDKIRTAVIGAAGVLGQQFVQLLDSHPTFELTALADIMVGKKYEDATKWRLGTQMPSTATDMKIVSNDLLSPRDVDLVFSALPGGIARKIEEGLAARGLFVVSKAKDHRMDKDVPLIVPEVNADHLGILERQRRKRGWKGSIVTDPNCSTTILVMSLKPLWDNFGLEKVVVSTMQAVSGAGYPGVPSLDIIDNVVPYISEEEEKMAIETKKLLGDGERPAALQISSSCNRVPTLNGHMESVFVKTARDFSLADVRNAFRAFKGLNYPTAPRRPIIVREEPDRPQTRLDRDAGNGMSVTVGRLREDEAMGLSYSVLGHNTIRGGAGGAVLVAELCHGKGYV
jgi:aspartate-semialdehyde dehydrogenase